jgi:hypothetical protein
MSILFVLLMFLLIISARYFIEPKNEPLAEVEVLAKAKAPLVKRGVWVRDSAETTVFILGICG